MVKKAGILDMYMYIYVYILYMSTHTFPVTLKMTEMT